MSISGVSMSISCVLCDTPLTGGLDTFGSPDSPLCLTCWMDMTHERFLIEAHYRQSMKRMSAALDAKDFDAVVAAYHDRYVGVTDSLAGLRRVSR
jgi:hypothetical protein